MPIGARAIATEKLMSFMSTPFCLCEGISGESQRAAAAASSSIKPSRHRSERLQRRETAGTYASASATDILPTDTLLMLRKTERLGRKAGVGVGRTSLSEPILAEMVALAPNQQPLPHSLYSSHINCTPAATMKLALPRLGSLLRPAVQPMRLARPAAAAAFHSTARAPQPAKTGSGIPFVSIYTQDSDIGAVIGGLSADGIELSAPADLVIPGSAIILGGRTLLWDVKPPAKGEELSWKGWQEDAFKVFEVVGPRPGQSPCCLTGRGIGGLTTIISTASRDAPARDRRADAATTAVSPGLPVKARHPARHHVDGTSRRLELCAIPAD